MKLIYNVKQYDSNNNLCHPYCLSVSPKTLTNITLNVEQCHIKCLPVSPFIQFDQCHLGCKPHIDY